LREPLVEGLPQLKAEVIYAAREEMALTLADFLARRTRLAILAGQNSLKCAAAAAQLMARELGWNDEETERQIAQFGTEFEQEYGGR
jgi:glycerol-3-phosphate dehydrogenase